MYQGPPLDLAHFYAELPTAVHGAGFDAETYGESAGWPLLVLRRAAMKPDAPRMYLSAGIHGDEPAGPLALLQLLRDGFFGGKFHWLIFPALNPGGLAAKKRGNPAGVDVNRDYREPKTPEAAQHLAFLTRETAAGRGQYAVCLMLHEDWESKGFYLYELNRTPQPLLGPAVLAAAEGICGVDTSPVIEEMEANRGLITRPLEGMEARPQWPEAIYLALRHTERSLTFESPSAQALERRVTAHGAGVRAALAEWERQN